MLKTIRKYGTVIFAGLLLVLLGSCGGSGGGADDDEASVQYRVELTDGSTTCLRRIQYYDEDGDRRTVSEIDDPDWRRTIYAKDGARLYLQAEIDCGEVTIYVYLNGSQAERARSSIRATIEGTLRIDEEGNATFEED